MPLVWNITELAKGFKGKVGITNCCWLMTDAASKVGSPAEPAAYPFKVSLRSRKLTAMMSATWTPRRNFLELCGSHHLPLPVSYTPSSPRTYRTSGTSRSAPS